MNHEDNCKNAARSPGDIDQSGVVAALRSLGVAERRREAPARLEALLLAAFREHKGTHALRRHPRWIPFLSCGAAAAAAFALFLPLWTGPNSARQAGMLADAALADAFRHPVNFAAASAAGFVPLPNAAQLEPDEEVNLVRLEIPRSAVVALGLETRASGASDAVAADVLLGYDGLARAVRLLDE